MSDPINKLYADAVTLLKQLIATPSFSREEQGSAMALQHFLQSHGVTTDRIANNIWAKNMLYNEALPTILLNSHHDTVKPNSAYKLDPFMPQEQDGRLHGLGSNDAGGPLVCLLAAFLYFYDKPGLKYNLIFAAVGEEEISGANGIELLIPHLGSIDAAIVGEPTLMEMAVAEKGLMVLDCKATGVSGHAAREEGDNAIYKAMKDIEWFGTYKFDKVSPTLGPVKMSVTMIQAGTQHNVVPATCNFTVDIRVNDCYTNQEILDIVREQVSCDVHPRSLRLQSTAIADKHPLVQAGLSIGKKSFGSATLSDKALMPFPALKMGPGDSARSHSADEFIYLDEIEKGIQDYIALLNIVLL